jgi:hypothetical protein
MGFLDFEIVASRFTTSNLSAFWSDLAWMTGTFVTLEYFERAPRDDHRLLYPMILCMNHDRRGKVYQALELSVTDVSEFHKSTCRI